MNSNLRLVIIDSKYCDFLRKFDKKVPYNYHKKKNRPFVGVLFKIDNLEYFAPLSSPKPKHKLMHDMIDFLRIDGGKLGVVNFNNMIPVSKSEYSLIDFNKISDLFGKNYVLLLKNQIYWLIRHDEKLYRKSKKIYKDYIKGKLNKKIKERCCNFKLLEEKCKEYNENIVASS